MKVPLASLDIHNYSQVIALHFRVRFTEDVDTGLINTFFMTITWQSESPHAALSCHLMGIIKINIINENC